MTTILDINVELGSNPTKGELDRLIKYYPEYKYEHGMVCVVAYFEDETSGKLVKMKLSKKKINPTNLTPEAHGGHPQWVIPTTRKWIIRVLYLRYRLDHGISKIKANQQINKKYGSETFKQDSIRTVTRTDLLDD